MSRIALSGNPSGSGTLTIASPNTNSDVTINLPTVTGGNFIVSDASGNVGIGTNSPTVKLDVSGGTGIRVNEDTIGTKIITLRSNWAGFAPAVNVTTTDPLLLMTANTERMRINAGAPILCLLGGNTSATGTGIAFPATQSASSDANTLDDYEEGTWSPVLTSSGGGSVSLQNGRYVKVGQLVTITIANFGVSTTGLSAGNLSITGFPFAHVGQSHSVSYFQLAGSTSASTGNLIVYMEENGSNAILYKAESTAADIVQLTRAEINNSISLRFNGFYYTT